METMMVARGSKNERMRLVCLVLAIMLVRETDADSSSYDDAWSNSFTYHQAWTVDLDMDDRESSRLAFETPALLEDSSVKPRGHAADTTSSSILLYDEQDCLLSLAAMGKRDSAATVMNTLRAGLEQGEIDKNDDDEDDDSDNDDNDDGHSAMLSTASLPRSRISAGGGLTTAPTHSPTRRSSSSPLPFAKPRDTVLQIRGGGAAVAASSDNNVSLQIVQRLIVTALVTLVFEGTIGHLLEFFKIVMQTSSEPMSYWQVLQSITAEKGILGLWDGFVPWGVMQALGKGAVFGLAYATAHNVLLPMAERGTLPTLIAMTLAGGIGGYIQGFVLSPTLLLKTRVMTNPIFRERMSAFRTTMLSFQIGADVVHTEGMNALMKGSNVFATKRFFDWSSRYLFSDLFESLLHYSKGDETLSVYEKSAASFLGGVASTCVTLPLDVLVAKTQDAKKANVKVSALALFRDELKQKGLGGTMSAYMQGFEARLAHVCLTTVVIKTGTPIVFDALFGTR